MAGEDSAWEGIECDFYWLTFAQFGNILLLQVGHHPSLPDFHDLEKSLAGVDHLARVHGASRDDAVDGRIKHCVVEINFGLIESRAYHVQFRLGQVDLVLAAAGQKQYEILTAHLQSGAGQMDVRPEPVQVGLRNGLGQCQFLCAPEIVQGLESGYFAHLDFRFGHVDSLLTWPLEPVHSGDRPVDLRLLFGNGHGQLVGHQRYEHIACPHQVALVERNRFDPAEQARGNSNDACVHVCVVGRYGAAEINPPVGPVAPRRRNDQERDNDQAKPPGSVHARTAFPYLSHSRRGPHRRWELPERRAMWWITLKMRGQSVMIARIGQDQQESQLARFPVGLGEPFRAGCLGIVARYGRGGRV